MRRLLAAVAILALAAPAAADTASARTRLDRLLAAAKVPAGKFGIHVSDSATGERIFAAAADIPRIPASTMKLATTITAFVELGTDYRFRTRVLGSGRPRPGGVLPGDLVIVGGGDPTLEVGAAAGAEPGKLDRLARLVAGSGVRRIAGDLVLDDGRFDDVHRHPSWPENQLTRSYCAPVSALTVSRGCVTVRVRPGAAAGAPGVVTLSPATRTLSVENLIKTTSKKSEHKIILDLRPGQSRIRATGRVWVKSTGYEGEVSVPDPTGYFGDVFRQALVRCGVSVGGKIVRRPGAAAEIEGAVELAAIETPLLEVLAVTNRESQNLFADCLLKTLGFERAGEGSFQAGAAVVANFAESLGLAPKSIRQADGSGLSRENTVSPAALTRLLDRVFETADPVAFIETLAVAGDPTGTLRKRMHSLGTAVRAKTGTIRSSSCLAGYVRSKSGRVLSFSVLVNDPDIARARRLQDGVCKILYEEF